MLYKIPESVLVIIYTLNLKVLLIERADHIGYWQSVTGSKNTIDEPLYITAQREVKEETNIIINNATRISSISDNYVPYYYLCDWNLTNIYEIYPIWRNRYAHGVFFNIEHVFSLLVPNNISVTLALREHIRYQWLPYYQAADQCFSPSNAQAILHLPYYIDYYRHKFSNIVKF